VILSLKKISGWATKISISKSAKKKMAFLLIRGKKFLNFSNGKYILKNYLK